MHLFHVDFGGGLLFRAVSSQVPSALKGLTSVFGMGTGGTPSPLPPKIVSLSCGLRFQVLAQGHYIAFIPSCQDLFPLLLLLLQPCRCASLALLTPLFSASLALFALLTLLALLRLSAPPASPRSLRSVSGAQLPAVFGLVPSALLTLPAVCSGLRFPLRPSHPSVFPACYEKLMSSHPLGSLTTAHALTSLSCHFFFGLA